MPSIADVDADGVPEVVTQWGIFNGIDGSTEVLLDRYYDDWTDYVGTGVYFVPVVSDVDRDGTWEIFLEDSVYASNGTHLWDAPPFPEDAKFIGSGVADFHGDASAEVVTAGLTSVGAFDTAGAPLFDSIDELSQDDHDDSRLPVIADLDGDGSLEIAVAGDHDVALLETNGTIVWISTERYDHSGLAGCSAFDFDVDDAYELVCADEQDLRIYDGRTGDVLFTWSGHESGTGQEYPVVADVDADGSAEIVLACNAGFPNGEGQCRGVAVLGHRHDAWPPAGPVWSVHDYTPLRIRPDGRVETELIAPWSIHNMFLARPPGDGLAELAPVAGETCLTSCENGPWKVTWGVLNQGWVNVREPIDVAIYRLDGDQATLLEVRQVEYVEYGYQKAGATIELGPDEWGDGIRIVVDDDGTGLGFVVECDEGNNLLEIAAPTCP